MSAEQAPPGPSPDEARRRRVAALAGHAGDAAGARRLVHDPSPGVRATALGALARARALVAGDLVAALGDPDAAVRRRACALAARVPEVDLVPSLADPDPLVVETAAWALGERPAPPPPGVVAALGAVAADHADALCREAAVAALGALGDPAGLPAVLDALGDKPAVRRRAVLALAPFEGPDVEAALRRARSDRDWQVRQAAEDLAGDGD